MLLKSAMPRKARDKPKTDRLPTEMKAWRNFRDMTLETLSLRLQTLESVSISDGQLSRIERAESPYHQDILEPIARVLGCSVPQLISMKPRAGIDEGQPMTPEEAHQVAAFLKALRG